MKTLKWRLEQLAAFAVLLFVPMAAQAVTATATQTLTASLSPIGKVSVLASLSLTHAGTTFVAFTGSIPVSFRARTNPGGSGAITVQATSDFSPSGGPSVASSVLTYTCSGATLGTACSGTKTVSTSTQTSVLTIPASACTGGGGACSASDPNSVSVNLTLTDDPSYSTGSYSALLTFTISAT
jgi:hypothetical protein